MMVEVAGVASLPPGDCTVVLVVVCVPWREMTVVVVVMMIGVVPPERCSLAVSAWLLASS